LDSNGDHRLTRAELNRINQMFERLDANKDGALDAAELRTISESSDGPPNGNSRSTPDRSSGNSRTRETSDRTSDAGASRLAGVWRGWVVDGRGENPNSGQMEIELTIEGNRITGRELGTRRAP
jgi:hypothetical protein